jgi:hypothetical protein
MKNKNELGEVATPKSMLAAFIITLVALTGCEQSTPLKVVENREGCFLLNGEGLTIHDIKDDGTVSLVSDDGVVLYSYTILDKPFQLEGVGRKGDPIFIGIRYVDNVYENGKIDRDLKKVAVASKNEENWKKYFADKVVKGPPGTLSNKRD